MNPDPKPIEGMRDAGPPHHGLLCFHNDWLCRYPAGDAHSHHAPYVENEYLEPLPPPASPQGDPVIPKRLFARIVTIALAAILIGGFSAVPYFDNDHSWPAVAVYWAGFAICAAIVAALVWGLDNWNAR